MSRGERVAARARALVGVKFRPQGRSVEQGLDCIGAAVMATGIDPARVRRDYGLRNDDPEPINRELDDVGFVRIAPAAAEPGDLLIVRAGPARLHVAILTPAGFLHADARLRLVVEVPGWVPWPILSAWRYPDEAALADKPGRADELN